MRTVRPNEVAGAVVAPPSKSMMQRALAAALLAEGETRILNPSLCEDAGSAMRAIAALGARVEVAGDRVLVRGGGTPTSREVDCGESGLCLRTLAPVAALFDGEFTLRGSGSLLRRPMQMLCAPLLALGADCRTAEGFAPVVVRGPLRGGEAEVDASVTSQVLTGLLTALPLTPLGGRLTVSGLKSRPYLQMTLELLRQFGVEASCDPAWREFVVPGRQRFRPCELVVEGDWSGAAFLLVAGALAGEVRVEGLRPDSPQADRAVLEALRRAGAQVALDGGAAVATGGQLRGFEFDLTESPDLLPPLVALAVHARGESRFTGTARLRFKESDRVRVLAEELGNLGGQLRAEPDALVVRGGRLRGGRVRAHGDHRVAMACAVAGLRAEGPVEIEGPECVAKSYPRFFEALESLAAR